MQSKSHLRLIEQQWSQLENINRTTIDSLEKAARIVYILHEAAIRFHFGA
jgi:hypothetical protein